jgi:protein-S-isoprenylcysteine O-methyltransferase Ste14
MTMQQRAVWAQMFVFPLVGLVYFSVVLTRAASMPVDQISWVAPLIWAIGILIAGIIAVTIASAIGHGVVASARGDEPDFEDGDVRDKEIEREGDFRARHFTAFGGLVVIILAMLRADHFWIANAIFLAALLGAIYANALKIRMYRRGF